MRQSRSNMEDDSPKLVALKKAYADMILSTAKEAAARVMKSERKAYKYENELLVVKEEALRLLLRFKHISDTKISETEMILRSQQKKIEVLEAQHEAAEKVVKELQEELKELRDLLINRSCQLPHDLVAGSRASTSRAGEYAPSTSRNDSGVSGTNICHNSICNGSHYNSANKAENYDYYAYCDSVAKGCHNVNDPIFESRGLNQKESNGCTLKGDEYGRNLCGSNSFKCNSIPEERMDSSVKTGQVLPITPIQSLDIQSVLDDNLFEARRMYADVADFIGSSLMKKKRSVRHRKQITTSFSEMHGLDVKDKQACGISWPKNMMNQHVTEPAVCATTHVKLINGLIGVGNCGDSLAEDDVKQEHEVNGGLIGITCESNCKTNNGLPKIEKQKFASNAVPCMSLDNKFLKYTFQRKRKKEPLLVIDGESIQGMTSKQTPPVSDESQDKEQLMHVAQQLLSLSEKTLVKSKGPRN